MSTNTMYERLMTLPIFKGVGPEQVSLFLEKTNLEFVVHNSEDIIVSQGQENKEIICILSGEIETVSTLADSGVRLIAEYGSGKVLGLSNLFGMDLSYPYAVKAITECGTMSFSKSEYLRLIREDAICLINFLNYISYRAQRGCSAVSDICSNSLLRRLAAMVSILSDSDCKNLRIDGLTDIMPVSCPADKNDLDILIKYHIIERLSDTSIRILSRSELFDYAAGRRSTLNELH